MGPFFPFFQFDPFFGGFGYPGFYLVPSAGSLDAPFLDVPEPQANSFGYVRSNNGDSPLSQENSGEVPAEPPKPLTLLQLKDGSMYAMADYWLENGELHYVPSYGGLGVLALDSIDLDKTIKINWARGVEFVLRPKPSDR